MTLYYAMNWNSSSIWHHNVSFKINYICVSLSGVTTQSQLMLILIHQPYHMTSCLISSGRIMTPLHEQPSRYVSFLTLWIALYRTLPTYLSESNWNSNSLLVFAVHVIDLLSWWWTEEVGWANFERTRGQTQISDCYSNHSCWHILGCWRVSIMHSVSDLKDFKNVFLRQYFELFLFAVITRSIAFNNMTGWWRLLVWSLAPNWRHLI